MWGFFRRPNLNYEEKPPASLVEQHEREDRMPIHRTHPIFAAFKTLLVERATFLRGLQGEEYGSCRDSQGRLAVFTYFIPKYRVVLDRLPGAGAEWEKEAAWREAWCQSKGLTYHYCFMGEVFKLDDLASIYLEGR